jgi:hypothetical protein
VTTEAPFFIQPGYSEVAHIYCASACGQAEHIPVQALIHKGLAALIVF